MGVEFLVPSWEGFFLNNAGSQWSISPVARADRDPGGASSPGTNLEGMHES
jgi:hypothetical protein